MTTIAAKHVLVTGGASGIGRGLALRCLVMGADVTILDLGEKSAEHVLDEAA